MKSMILPPPVSVVLAGIRPTSGWVPSIVMAPFAVSPPALSVSLSSPPLQPAATSATAAVIATSLARFETLMVRRLLLCISGDHIWITRLLAAPDRRSPIWCGRKSELLTPRYIACQPRRPNDDSPGTRAQCTAVDSVLLELPAAHHRRVRPKQL